MALAQRPSPAGSRWTKKNDALQPPNQTPSIRLPWKSIRRKRLIQGLLVVLFVYLFVQNIPTDVPSVGRRYNSNFGSMASGHTKAHLDVQPGGEGMHDQITGESYEDPIRFSRLSDTLRAAMDQLRQDNVIFAVTSHASAQKLIPIICGMAQYNRSTVHVALMGKQDVTIHEIMALNSLDFDDCNVTWHDATPDHAAQLSLSRLHASVKTVLPYFNSALQPQVMLVDDVTETDPQLMSILKDTTGMLRIPLLTLPSRDPDSISWIAALDSRALQQFANVQIEIVIQAYSESAGSLIRLLRSIQRAHYHGLSLPHLTIELPPQVDPFVTTFLSGFKWPSGSSAANNQLTIRRRIDLKQINPAQASLRMVESFYPNSPSNSHVLVLSPDVELAPDYMHCLMFTILEYKYAARSDDWSDQLIGISLESPQSKLDGGKSFVDSELQISSSFIQSQMPNSNAAVYFGDKWVEFHDFLSKRLAADSQLTRDELIDSTTTSQKYPQWLAQMSELMIARAYTMLYPTFVQDERTNIVVVHTDLQHTPEEFVRPEAEEQTIRSGDDYAKLTATQGTLDGEDGILEKPTDLTIDATTRSILTLFGVRPARTGTVGLPELATMSMFSPTGELWDREQIVRASLNFADRFSVRVGGCSSVDARDRNQIGSVDYLFCEPD